MYSKVFQGNGLVLNECEDWFSGSPGASASTRSSIGKRTHSGHCYLPVRHIDEVECQAR